MKFSQYLKEKVQDIAKTIHNDLDAIRQINGDSRLDSDIQSISNYRIPAILPKVRLYESKPKAIYEIGLIDLLFFLLFAILAATSFILPNLTVLLLLGGGLLCSLLIRSTASQVLAGVAIGISTVSLLAQSSYCVSLETVFLLMMGTNEISLVPSIIGTIMVIIAMGGGLIHGFSGTARYAGFWLLALAGGLALADAFTAMGLLAFVEWYLILGIHFGLYLTSFFSAWTLFYLFGRGIRKGVMMARR